jgi:hypothetical protein
MQVLFTQNSENPSYLSSYQRSAVILLQGAILDLLSLLPKLLPEFLKLNA